MRLYAASVLATVTTAFAMPNPDMRFRAGANHHLGDDSFVSEFGRAPGDTDDEHVRMHVHLAHVRAWLADRPATRPELAPRRAELLRYLDDYIAKGITPKNTHLPWRTAVFIDDAGAICAVGYLIERSSGRALPEHIAAVHRYDFLEDIAAAMPEVRDWIAESGFTLDELASIQPAYSSPKVEQWRTWDLVRHAPPDGPFDKRGMRGAFKHKQMDGAWTVSTEAGVVVGKGELARGTGTWTSFYPDGKRVLGTGRFRDSVAHGPWTLFHPSGNVAAEGRFAAGARIGTWRFYADGKTKQLIATGRFAAGGSVTGTWQHFDGDGKLLARTYTEGQGDRIDVVPAADGIVHQVHQIEWGINPPVEMSRFRLERFALGTDSVYVYESGLTFSTDDKGIVFDAGGHRLDHAATGWTSADCHWSAHRKQLARAGELSWLHEVLAAESRKRGVERKVLEGHHVYYEMTEGGDKGPTCGAAVAVPADRAAQLDRLLAPREAIRAQSPTFVRELVLNEGDLDGKLDDDSRADREDGDLARVLAAYTLGYVEWPHIDGRFDRLFATMAGRIHWEWYDSEPEADGTSPLENARKQP